MNRIKLHERALLYRILNGTNEVPGLRNMTGVKVLLDYEDLTVRDLIIAIAIDNFDCMEAVRAYEKSGVIVYGRVAKSLYLKRMLESFGIEGAIRISPLYCHTSADVDQFLRITDHLALKYDSFLGIR